MNNPLGLVDPTGLQQCTDFENGNCVVNGGGPPNVGAPGISFYTGGVGSGSGGGAAGSGAGTGTGNPNAPNKPCAANSPSLLPRGFAFVGAAEATVGASKLGATAQASKGYGLFGGKPGSFFTYVATAVAGSHNPGDPNQQVGTNPTIVGAGAGVSLGAMITNATSVQQISGPFQQFTLSLSIVSISFAYSGNIWAFGATAGFGEAAATTSTTTNTKVNGPC